MLIHIVARGKIGRGPEGELVERYLARLPWTARVTELPDHGGKEPAIENHSCTVLLDETGKSLPSRVIAENLREWRDDGVREVRFRIGGADGFDDADRAAADHLWAFGSATWPHLLARAMLAEQLYRASTILSNHPYHREG